MAQTEEQKQADTIIAMATELVQLRDDKKTLLKRIGILEDMCTKILQMEWDENCETKEGLTEAYTYIPRSLIEQALKG